MNSFNKIKLGFLTLLFSSANAFSDSNYYLNHENELPNWNYFSNVTLVSGRPDFRLTFVRNTVVDGYAYVSPAEVNRTTQELSILVRRGIQRVSMGEVVYSDNSARSSDVYRALQFGASRSPVVAFALSSGSQQNNSTCRFMSQFTNTVFVTVGPNFRDSLPELECLAANILRITSLNADQSDLTEYAPKGETVRLAAPSYRIPTIGQGGYHSELSGLSPAVMIVAAELAKFYNMNPQLKGAALIDLFLETQSTVLPSLEGKVVGAKALFDSEL